MYRSLIHQFGTWIGLAAILFAFSLQSGFAQSPLVTPAPLVEDARTEEQLIEGIRLKWELDGIQSAISNGFVSIAETFVNRLLERDLDRQTTELLLNYRMHITLLKGNIVEAALIEDQLANAEMQLQPVLSAILAYFMGDYAEARATIGTVNLVTLSPGHRAWMRLVEALILSRENQNEAANKAFLDAARMAPTSLLRDHFEIIRLREDLKSGTFDADSISALRESVRSMRGERGGFEAARLLAIALDQNGNTSEAIDVLNSQLALSGLREFDLRSEFLLLLGRIAGPESSRGKLALRQLISEATGEIGNLSVAFSLLTQSFPESLDEEAFLRDINTWLSLEPAHPLTDRLLMYKAYLLILRESLEEAENSALRLLEGYPNSEFVNPTLRLLAFISWSGSPPRYRTAADYLNQLRQRLPSGRESLEIGLYIADCYFLNEDYTSASEAYSAVMNDASSQRAPVAFFQRVLSELGAERPELAERHIDAAYDDPRLELAIIWKAEWNLLDYYRREGRTDQAFTRINKILGRGIADSPVPPELLMRMEWIAARLTLEAGRPGEAEERASDLLARLDGVVYQNLDKDLLEEVESHLLLLRGEARLKKGEKESALQSFSVLRDRFPLSGPAILSYLVESRAESDEDNLVSAQQSLINLVDRFPESEYAPIALWEAALNAEQRGLVIHLQESISILERLVTEYPTHNLVYFARLKQGDLARRLNDFPTALLLYERLLAEHPDHPQRYRASMSRADCLMALGSEDATRLDLAAVVYERICLLSSAPMPIRMEAGFKWAHSLRQQGDAQGSEGVLWLLFERFVLDANVSQPVLSEDAGRYWMSRTLLELGNRQIEQGKSAAAVRVIEMIHEMGLPGSALAKAKLDLLR